MSLLFATAVVVAAEPTPSVEVSGRRLSVNGITHIPSAMFGVHATQLDADRIATWGVESVRTIEHAPSGTPPAIPVPVHLQCLFDRYQPAWQLRRPDDWREYLTTLAANTAKAKVPTGHSRIVEFWNEPYLNWAVKPGVNYDGAYYDYESATAGELMTIRGRSQPEPGMVWDKQVPVALHPGIQDVYYLATRFGQPLTPDKPLVFRGKEYRVEMRWWGRDSGQSTWWSGPANRRYYEEMVAVFAPELKATNPDLPLVVGWGFHLNQDNWAAWEALHKPLIDLAHPWIDGYNEHHYGGDTRMVAGTYETAYAYALGHYGKRLAFYNTEAGGMLDPERPDSSSPNATGTNGNLGEFIYTTRDILHLLAVSPDKAASRYAHEVNPGDGAATALTLLRDLRGELMECQTSDPAIYAVASRDGDRLCVVLFNDNRDATALELRVAAPTGMRILAGEIVTNVDAPLSLRTAAIDVTDGTWSGPVTIAGKRPVALRFDLAGEVAAGAPVAVQQFASGTVLQQIEPGESATYTISVPPGIVARATSARLRIVQDSGTPAMTVRIADETLQIQPKARWLHDQAIDIALLTARNELTFECPPDAEAGYHLCAVSLLVTCDPEAAAE